MSEDNLVALARALHQLDFTKLDEPDDPADIEDWKFLIATKSPAEIVHMISESGNLQEWRTAFAAVILEEYTIRDQVEEIELANVGPKYNKPTQRWRDLFKEIRDAARIKIANFEETDWVVIYSSNGSPQVGAQKRVWILKNKDSYLLPGVWHLSSKTTYDTATKEFVSNDTIVRYLGDAPDDDLTSVLVISNRRGRRANQPANS